MSANSVHFNGSVNLTNAEAVMREIASRVPSGVSRIPDGETGDRHGWVFCQLQKFWQTPGIEKVAKKEGAEGYAAAPKVRLSGGVDPETLKWPNLGYADGYQESFKTFQRLRKEGAVPGGIRFQVQYPTPLASVGIWMVPEDHERVLPSYERALCADLDRLLAAVPHAQLAVQWDVAIEIGIVEGVFDSPVTKSRAFDSVVECLVRCVDRVPADVPVGMHLCYGDFNHRHITEPKSLETQVRLANALRSAAHRPINWFTITVPQYQREAAFFAPLRNLQTGVETELYLGIVPYHPAKQEPGTTDEQVRLINENMPRRPWGICTECGMANCTPEEIAVLLDKHREILAKYGS